jgi:hypothetical protein
LNSGQNETLGIDLDEAYAAFSDLSKPLPKADPKTLQHREASHAPSSETETSLSYD